MRLEKTLFLLMLSLLLTLPSAQAKVFKIATLSPDGSSWMVKMRGGGKEIERLTQGRVKFKFYPGGVMGNDQTVLRKINLGQLQGGAVPGGSLVRFARSSQIYSLPLLFQSFDEVDFVRHYIDPIIVDELEQSGFVTFGLAEGGLAYLMSDSEITGVRDLKKKKIWVPDADPNAIKVVESFGLSPIPLSIGEVLPSLQTGIIDSVTTSPIAAIALQWHTRVQYMTNLPLSYFIAVLAIDGKAFSKISEQDQKLVRSVMGEVFQDIDLQNRQDNIAAFSALQALGVELSHPSNDEVADWRARARMVTEQLLHTGEVSQPLYQQVSGYLRTCRDQRENGGRSCRVVE
ncbi:MAG: TRAP transporter substrate-binding protein DctP, partial [Pseudomonadota bacterium]